jgi:hypothetical protein
MTSSSDNNNSNIIVEESTPEVFLPTTSIVKDDKLLLNQDINEDNPQNTCIYTKDSMSLTLNTSKPRQHEKVGCNFFQLLKFCLSWFCGLNDDDDDKNNDYSEIHPTRTVENSNTILKQRPIIKWLLNGNLIFILFVEIIIFIVFSIPAKYTFLRD